MDTEGLGVLGVGIVRRYEHHFRSDGKGANAPRIAALGAAELTDQRHGFLLGCAVEKVMGASSPRRRAPDEAAIAVLVGVERGGSTDDGVGRERAEIAAVETVADLPVHQETLAVRHPTAARPTEQGPPTPAVIESKHP